MILCTGKTKEHNNAITGVIPCNFYFPCVRLGSATDRSKHTSNLLQHLQIGRSLDSELRVKFFSFVFPISRTGDLNILGGYI